MSSNGTEPDVKISAAVPDTICYLYRELGLLLLLLSQEIARAEVGVPKLGSNPGTLRTHAATEGTFGGGFSQP